MTLVLELILRNFSLSGHLWKFDILDSRRASVHTVACPRILPRKHSHSFWISAPNPLGEKLKAHRSSLWNFNKLVSLQEALFIHRLVLELGRVLITFWCHGFCWNLWPLTMRTVRIWVHAQYWMGSVSGLSKQWIRWKNDVLHYLQASTHDSTPVRETPTYRCYLPPVERQLRGVQKAILIDRFNGEWVGVPPVHIFL